LGDLPRRLGANAPLRSFDFYENAMSPTVAPSVESIPSQERNTSGMEFALPKVKVIVEILV
jgi:hypothetical protein